MFPFHHHSWGLDWFSIFERVIALAIVAVPAFLYRYYRYLQQEEILHELAKLRTKGVELRNEGSKKNLTKKEFDEWRSELKDWENVLITTAEKFSPVVSERLKTLDLVPAIKFKKVTNDKQLRTLSYFTKTLERVDHILETRFRPTHAP